MDADTFVDTFLGTVAGALIAFFGTWLVVRESRSARKAEAQNAAVAILSEQLRRQHVEGWVDDDAAVADFSERCRSAILLFGKQARRNRLLCSVDLIAAALSTGGTQFRHDIQEFPRERIVELARKDMWECLEKRDRKRLPKADSDWKKIEGEYNKYRKYWEEVQKQPDTPK